MYAVMYILAVLFAIFFVAFLIERITVINRADNRSDDMNYQKQKDKSDSSIKLVFCGIGSVLCLIIGAMIK